jgi:tetratricopeptide (TPR) repeat protein
MPYSVEMISKLARVASASILFVFIAFPAQSQTSARKDLFEATSRIGRKLYALPDTDGSIAAARKSLSADPKNVALVLKLSRAQAAKRQYREAVATCTAGLRWAPNSADLYLERGHRELGLREFKQAQADLTRAVEIDPQMLDAQYHLGMAHYFLREFPQAAERFQKALALAKTNDSIIDCSNWSYVSLRRAGQTAAAAKVLSGITPDIKNKEPHLYFYLRLLRFYQGAISEADLLPRKPANPNDTESELSFDTVSYGVGNWHLYTHTNPARARELFQNVMTGNAWNAWGFIGSELELSGK